MRAPAPRTTAQRLALGAPLGLGLAVAMVATACNDVDIGSGDQVSRRFDVEDFTEVEINNAIEAVIDVGEDTEVNIDVDEALADDLEVRVSNGRLVVRLDGISIGSTAPTEARISTPSLDALEVTGASEVEVRGLDADSFELDVSGASEVTADGRVDRLSADASGASRVDLDSLDIEVAEVDVSGASSVDLAGAATVAGSASGASRIDVADDAEVDIDTSGASSVD